MAVAFLDFEQPIAELEAKIEELKHVTSESEVNIQEEIGRLQAKIAAENPGMKISISEYENGGFNHIAGTVAEADNLAVLAEVMRENQFYPNGRGRLADSVAATVERIAASHAFTSLNAMIVTPDELIAVCYYDPVAEEKEEEPDYYRLGYRVTPGAVIVSSSGWGAEWSSLENGQILVVQRDTLDVSVGWMADARMTR